MVSSAWKREGMPLEGTDCEASYRSDRLTALPVRDDS